ncbi:MAG: histidine kinase dimerization/phospho-acceptor domain-containing protein [Candidatus Acidiferrales bacterium]
MRSMAAVRTEGLVNCTALAGIAGAEPAARLEREMERFGGARRVTIVETFAHLRELASRTFPRVILLDASLAGGAALAGPLRQLTESAPVVVLAPAERQAEIARLVAEGDVEFVARAGDYIPLAAALLERRLRWAERSEAAVGPPWKELPGDVAEIFRHEINNPLTGVLGNAELVLAHRERLHSVDAQRLQTVVELAVRLRETVRRLSNSWEAHSVKSA